MTTVLPWSCALYLIVPVNCSRTVDLTVSASHAPPLTTLTGTEGGDLQSQVSLRNPPTHRTHNTTQHNRKEGKGQRKSEVCEQITDLNLKHSLLGTDLKVRLILYTRENTTCGRLLSHENPFETPTFNSTRPCTFIIHGYRPTGSPPVWMFTMVESILNRSDINVIVVDWNRGAANVNYFKVVKNTQTVADIITCFIQNAGLNLSSIHMIGVSLGAHISGFTGAKYNGSIGRITALDPAGPLFRGKSTEERLDPSDAQFVDALHTDMDAFGYRDSLGHIDYYANGGSDQPGCPKSIFSGSKYFKCDHQRSVFLYLDSMNQSRQINAYPCSDYSDFLDGKCLNCERFNSSGCPVFGYDVIRWRDVLLKLGQTMTFFTTNKEAPFYKSGYKVEIMSWNSEVRWGYITITLKNRAQETETRIDHKSYEFQQFNETTLLAQFERDVYPVEKITLKYVTANKLTSRYKLRVLRFRLTPLKSGLRPLCRYDLLLLENTDVTFRPISCHNNNNF
ncbi:lipase member H isoform X1 [Hemibagrus wyckioides]|uniref:lipase member H isoform X1 n=1 Tax=Hemibagrus wyckioides TaxID=337641 RepID=UPI00266CF96C|nr:lipase member H isoform X1 [Hemibagrus wyckioides]